MVVIALNHTPHYSHRENDNFEDLTAKRQRLQGKWTTNKKAIITFSTCTTVTNYILHVMLYTG